MREFVKSQLVGGSVRLARRHESPLGVERMALPEGLPDQREFLVGLDAPELADLAQIEGRVAGGGLEAAEIVVVEGRTIDVVTPGAVFIVARNIAVGRDHVALVSVGIPVDGLSVDRGRRSLPYEHGQEGAEAGQRKQDFSHRVFSLRKPFVNPWQVQQRRRAQYLILNSLKIVTIPYAGLNRWADGRPYFLPVFSTYWLAVRVVQPSCLSRAAILTKSWKESSFHMPQWPWRSIMDVGFRAA